MNWIGTLSKAISDAFNFVRKPAQAIPPILLLCEINTRPGLSAMALTSAIITRLPEAGIDTAPLPDGTQPRILGVIRISVEETIKHIQNNAVVDNVVAPGGVTVTVAGANAGGPVTCTGSNISAQSIRGIIR